MVAKHLLHVSHIVTNIHLTHKWYIVFDFREHSWTPLIPFYDNKLKTDRFKKLKKILHNYVFGKSQWSIRSRGRNVPVYFGGRSFKWGFHAVSEWTDLPQGGVSSLGGRIIHIDHTHTGTHARTHATLNTQHTHNTHTHTTHTANTVISSQWSMGNGHFVWPFSSICYNRVGRSNG